MLDREELNVEAPLHTESEYFNYMCARSIVLMAILLWSVSVLLAELFRTVLM